MKQFFRRIRNYIILNPLRFGVLCAGILLALAFVVGLVMIAIGVVSDLGDFYYDYTEMTDQIARVEIVEVTYNDQDELNIKVLQTFDEETMLPLLQDLSQLRYRHVIYPTGDPQMSLASGNGLRIVFKDGSTDILTNFCTQSKGASNHPHFHKRTEYLFDNQCRCDQEELQQLVDKYLD